MRIMTPQVAVANSILEVRLKFESMLSDLPSGFVNVEPETVDREIENAQRRVCDCLDLDLAALWQMNRNRGMIYWRPCEMRSRSA